MLKLFESLLAGPSLKPVEQRIHLASKAGDAASMAVRIARLEFEDHCNQMNAGIVPLPLRQCRLHPVHPRGGTS
jgi:hypothetical protein